MPIPHVVYHGRLPPPGYALEARPNRTKELASMWSRRLDAGGVVERWGVADGDQQALRLSSLAVTWPHGSVRGSWMSR